MFSGLSHGDSATQQVFEVIMTERSATIDVSATWANLG
jgi:hypothetical protein